MSDTATAFRPEDCCWAASGWEDAGEGYDEARAASSDERLREAGTEYRVVGPRWQGTSYQHRSYAEDERRCMIDPARYRIEQRTVTTSDWVTVSDE